MKKINKNQCKAICGLFCAESYHDSTIGTRVSQRDGYVYIAV
jgi:hypothetical protein